MKAEEVCDDERRHDDHVQKYAHGHPMRLRPLPEVRHVLGSPLLLHCHGVWSDSWPIAFLLPTTRIGHLRW